MNKKLLKICCSEWKNASRDERELSACREIGFDVSVMAKGNFVGKNAMNDIVDGFAVTRMSSRPCGKKLGVGLNRIISLFTWAKQAKKMSPDIISGHDLEGLFVGYLATLFLKKKNKPLLVYDSHEFELGRNRNTGRNARSFFVKMIEGFLMKRCAFSIMVSDYIAKRVQEIHKLKTMPIVVRSTPNFWELDKTKIANTRKELLSSMRVDDAFVVMYHGALYPHRGIENMFYAIAEIEGIAAVILGNGDEQYVKELQELCEKLSLQNRVVFHEAVHSDKLSDYVASANVGFAIMEPVTMSYFYSLPNKLFENIQSLTPVIVSDFPAMKDIVDRYEIGITVNPADINQIRNAIISVKEDADLYAKYKDKLAIAKRELCWENEKKVLIEAYSNVFDGRKK